MIFLDTYEPKPLKDLITALALPHQIPIDNTSLQYADYFLIPKDSLTIGIERKAVSDFIGSLQSGRLDEQLLGVRTTYTYSYLLLEGPLTWLKGKDNTLTLKLPGRSTSWGFPAVQNYLSTLHLKGIGLIHTNNSNESALAIINLYRYLQRTTEPSYMIPTSLHRTQSPLIRLLCCIPGIGPDTASRLYNKFPTLTSLIQAQDDIILRVEGVGPKTLKNIRDVLGRMEWDSSGQVTQQAQKIINGQSPSMSGSTPNESALLSSSLVSSSDISPTVGGKCRKLKQ